MMTSARLLMTKQYFCTELPAKHSINGIADKNG